MHEKHSRTFRVKNANITIHGYSAGTAILSVTTTQEGGDTVSVWVSPEELVALGNALISCGNSDICAEVK